jgi:hypothetical protein
MTASIIRIAATSMAQTQVAAKAALKAAGLKQTLVWEVLAAVSGIETAQKTAKADRIARKLGYCPVDPVSPRLVTKGKIVRRDIISKPGRIPVRLPAGTPQTRLNAVRTKTVKSTLEFLIDHHAHGEWFVNLTTDPAAVGIKTNAYYTGEKAGKWSIQATDTKITVPADWRVRVQRKGLAVVDGLMTLDAAAMEANGCELFAATWARRTGAKNVTVDKGYIARADGVSYHGATADQALSGLAKKRRELALSIRLDAADLGDLVAKLASVRVSVGDARATGACVYGIRSWCAAVGLDFQAGSATLAEVYAAYQREPRPEARATLLRVLRRQRPTVAAI